MRYNPALDGIRAFAVLAVVVFHRHYFPGGYQGVDVFFVLSGYLITSILLTEYDRWERIDLRAFYSRRLLRLYPALLAMLVIVVPIAALASSWERKVITAKGIFFAGTYTKNFAYLGDWGVSFFTGHTWTLAVEEQFYLVWPWVLLLLLHRCSTRRTAAWALAVAGVVIFGLYALFTWRWSVTYAQYLPPTDDLELVLGSALALVPSVARPARSLVAPLLAAGGFAVVSLNLHQYSDGTGYWGVLVTGASSLLLVAHVVSGGALTAALSAGPLVWIGRRSYGVYLYHFPIDRVYSMHVHSKPLAAVGVIATSLIVAALSYRYVEQPFLRRKHRFERVPTAGRPDA